MADDGKLGFSVSLTDESVERVAKEVREQFRLMGDTAVAEGKRIEDSFLSIGKVIGTVFSAKAAMDFTKQVFMVRSEMQNIEASMRVFLGSTEKAAEFFKELQKYAYYNVFEFKDLAAQSAQLLAYGSAVEDVIPTLNKLSEIAAGTSAPLQDLVALFNKVKANDVFDARAVMSLGNMGVDVKQVLADIRSIEEGHKVLRNEIQATSLTFED